VFLLTKSLPAQSPQKTQSHKRSFFCVLSVLGGERLLDSCLYEMASSVYRGRTPHPGGSAIFLGGLKNGVGTTVA
jgi:hypothetical protein